jgi:hypothetical protein
METANHKSEQSLEESAEELKTPNPGTAETSPDPVGTGPLGWGGIPGPGEDPNSGQAPELPALTWVGIRQGARAARARAFAKGASRPLVRRLSHARDHVPQRGLNQISAVIGLRGGEEFLHDEQQAQPN